MIADLKPYSAMKDSGVEWLGDVPEHWAVVRLGRLLRERGENNENGKMTHVLSLLRLRGVIPYDDKGRIGNKKSEDITRYKIVRPNDIVMNSMNVIIGSVGLSSYSGCLSPVYYVLVARDGDHPKFLDGLFQCARFHKSLVRIGNGILAHRMRIPMELLKCELLPRPPLPEQAAIVHFLDHMDKRVQRCIRAKQKLIKLLEEQKQAIIHQAVTRGLNLDAPMKDSGVEWLGDVPEHWEVRRLRTVSGMRVSSVDKHTKEDEVPVRLCNYVDVYKNDRIRASMDFMKATATDAEINRFRLEVGDVLITKDSESWDDIGVPSLVTEPASDLISGYHLALLRPVDSILSGGFLFRLIESTAVAYQFHVEAKGVTRYGLSHSAIKAVWMPLPPLPEQAVIVEHLAKASANISGAIDRAQREIGLLGEYRTRLIADVVTGKLDVRDAAAKLPEESDDAGLVGESCSMDGEENSGCFADEEVVEA